MHARKFSSFHISLCIPFLCHFQIVKASFSIVDMLFMSLGISMKVLLGETPGCEWNNSLPSKAGLRTVLEVLKIQMNFWPTLASTLTKLESEWESYLVESRSKYPFF